METQHWFGLKAPEGIQHSSLMGARAIHRLADKCGCDFVGDRWSSDGLVAQENGRSIAWDFVRWVEQVGIAHIREHAGFHYSGELDCAPYHLKFQVGGGGYVYCGFWKDKTWDFENVRQVRNFIKPLLPGKKFKVRSFQGIPPTGSGVAGRDDELKLLFEVKVPEEDRDAIALASRGLNLLPRIG